MALGENEPTTRQRQAYYDIEDIHARIKLPDWMSQRWGLVVSSTGTDTTPIDCPRCQTGKTNKANVKRWPDGRQTFKCFRCDPGGRAVDAIDLLVELGEARNRGEAIRILGETVGANTDDRSMVVGKKRRARKPKPLTPVVDNDSRPDEATAARIKAAYLDMRGWSPSVWNWFGLEVVYRNGRLAVRHPFRYKGEIWSWQDRMMSGDIKWMTAKSAPQMPFNIDTIGWYNEHHFVHITEGPADAISLTEALESSYPAIAALGSTSWQERWGKALTCPLVIITGDNDEAGAKFIAKVNQSVRDHAGFVGVVIVPDPHNDLSEWWKSAGTTAAADIERQLAYIERQRIAALNKCAEQ